MPRVGARVPIVVNTRDANGALENDGNVQITIHLATGGTLGPFNAPSVAPGKHQYDWDTAAVAPGLHSWTSTTATHGDDASDVIDLQPAVPQGLMSHADARAQLNDSAATISTEELRAYIDATTAVVEGIIGPVVPRTVTERLTSGGEVIILSQSPVISVTSIVPYITGYGASYIDTDLLVEPSGIVRRVSGLSFSPYDVTVVYRAGRTVMPPAVKLAAAIIIGHLWETQNGSGQVRALVQGGADEPVIGAGYAVPRRAAELLEPFRTSKLPAIA